MPLSKSMATTTDAAAVVTPKRLSNMKAIEWLQVQIWRLCVILQQDILVDIEAAPWWYTKTA